MMIMTTVALGAVVVWVVNVGTGVVVVMVLTVVVMVTVSLTHTKQSWSILYPIAQLEISHLISC